MKKIFTVIFGFLLGLYVFMPKKNIVFFIQKELSKYNVYINTSIHTDLFSVTLANSEVFYKGMDLASVKKIKIYPFVFYNKINIDNVTLNIGNYKIKKIYVTYSVLSPKKAVIKLFSDKIAANGYIDIFNKKIYLRFTKTDNTLSRFLKKDKKGYFFNAKY